MAQQSQMCNFPHHSCFMHAFPKVSFGVHQNDEPVERAHPFEETPTEVKKANFVLPPIFCAYQPLFNNEKPARIQGKHCTRKEKLEMSADKWEKNRLITNSWVAIPKKMASLDVFMRPERSSRILKRDHRECASKQLFRKQECLSLNPKHLTGFPSSL